MVTRHASVGLPALPAGRVRQPEQVAVADALALAVLDRLVGDRLRRPGCVPAADRAPQRAAPAAEALHERGELEQVRAGAADLGSASSAALRVASSSEPAAIARAKIAGSFFGAGPRR